MPLSKVFVCGVTGTQGSGVATALHRQSPSTTITSVSRNTDSEAAQAITAAIPNLQLHKGSFDDAPVLAEAMLGADALFMNFAPNGANLGAEKASADQVLAAAKAAGVKHVVYTSSPSVNDTVTLKEWDPAHPLVGLIQSKQAIETSVQNGAFESWTILRPANFMSNFVAPMANMYLGLTDTGVWTNAYQAGNKLPLVCKGTIGNFAAAAFLNPNKFHQQRISIADEFLSVDEILAKLSKIVGTELKAHYASDEEARALPKTSLKNFVLEAQLVTRRLGDLVDMNLVKQHGVELSSFDEYLESEKDAVLATFSQLKK